MASDPITSWEIDGQTVETVSDFIFGGSKITADGDCSHEIRHFTSWKESYDQPRQYIKKQRHYFVNKCTSSQCYVFFFFLVIMYGCESCSIKKAECWRIDSFELRCWRRLLKIPWTARRSNQSILQEISLEYSLEYSCWSWNSNTLATWCEELTHLKRPWWWVRLRAGGEGDDRGWDGWMASPMQWTWVWANSGREGQGSLVCCNPWGHKESDMA